MKRWFVAPLCAVLVVGSTAACSDDDPELSTTASTEATLSLAEWQRQTIRVCDEYRPEVEALEGALAAESSSPEGFVAFLEETMPLGERFLADLVAVGIPDERAADVRRLYAIDVATVDASRRAIAAAAAGDEEGMYAALEGLVGPNPERKALLVDLGVPACDFQDRSQP